MRRQVFFSFHYALDNWRAGQVRNIGSVEGNTPVSDNDWETVKSGGENAIRHWIDRQMENRTCAVVLVGAQTAGRRWIKYEIRHAWESDMGVVGIRVHGLEDSAGRTTVRGSNPFSAFSLNGRSLGSIVQCYDPPGTGSKAHYAWISENLADKVEEAIWIRRAH